MNVKASRKSNRSVFLPIIVVLMAVLLIALNKSTGLDGAAKASALMFWYLPAIVWSGYICLANLGSSGYSRYIKLLLVMVWVVPSVPLCLLSFYGIMLLLETGFGILF